MQDPPHYKYSKATKNYSFSVSFKAFKMTVCQHASIQQLEFLFKFQTLGKVSHLLVYLKIWKMLWCYTELIIDPVNITASYLSNIISMKTY